MMKRRSTSARDPRWGAMLLLYSLAACSGQNNEGSVELSALALTSADVASVTITISGTGIGNPMVVALAKGGDRWGGIIGAIPAGTNRTFTLSARDAAGKEIYWGQATGVTITAGQTIAVTIVGQQVNVPPPLRNAAPVIDALVVSSVSVAPGEVVTLTVLAHDPNAGDVLSYHWTANGGSFDSATTATTTWSAPSSSGSHRITIEVRDQRNAKTTMDVAIDVDPSHGRGKARIDVGLNSWPVVEDLTAEPGRIDVGETTVLAATASDADGDPLSYAWASDCAGTFSSGTNASTNFTLFAAPSGAACAFTVTVADGRGGSNTGTLTIAAGPPPMVDVAPQVLSTYQSRDTAADGDTVVLRVQAVDPNGAALGFAWTATVGTLAPANTQGGTSEIVWTAPVGFGATARILVTISKNSGLATEVVFELGSGAACLADGSACTSASQCCSSFCGAGGCHQRPAFDTAPPTIENLILDPTPIDVTSASAPIELTLVVSDDFSGLSWAFVGFESPTGGQAFYTSCSPSQPPTPEPVTVTCAARIPRYSEAGVWRVSYIRATDLLGHEVILHKAALEARGFPTSITLIDANPDLSPPVLSALSFPVTVDPATGLSQTTPSVTVSDALSGFLEGWIEFDELTSGRWWGCNINRLGQGSEHMEPGTWQVRSLQLKDVARNTVEFDRAALEALGLPTTVTVAGSDDVVPPHLVAFSFTPTSVDLATGDAHVTVTVDVADDETGVDHVQMGFYSPSQIQSLGCGMTGNWGAKLFHGTCDVLVPANGTELGTWSATNVWMWDMAGNRPNLSTADLEAAGFSTALVVSSSQ